MNGHRSMRLPSGVRFFSFFSLFRQNRYPSGYANHFNFKRPVRENYFQKVLPLGKYHSNAKLQVHSSRQVHARATRFTSGNAARPIRQGKKNLVSIETFEIEFHLTESQIGISRVQVALDFRNLSRHKIRPFKESSV